MALTNEEIMRATEIALRQHGAVLREDTYEPRVWNDEGVYTHFYIDFGNVVAPFSTGMLSMSLVIHDSVQIPITDFSKVSNGVYKVYVNLTGKNKGVTVLHKKTTYLLFADGTKIPPFSTFFYVSGLDRYEPLQYVCELTQLPTFELTASETTVNLDAWLSTPITSPTETAQLPNWRTAGINEVVSVTLK